MLVKKVAYLFATGFGSGYFPVMPGTFASLVALLIFSFIPLSSLTWILIILIFFIIGVWTSGIVEDDKGEDPGIVVVDEFVGLWIALVFLPPSTTIIIAGFLIFRLFDIWKPFPINISQKLSRGWGIMMDDVIAGLYTNILLQIILIVMRSFQIV